MTNYWSGAAAAQAAGPNGLFEQRPFHRMPSFPRKPMARHQLPGQRALRETPSAVRSTGEGAVLDAAAAFPPQLRECIGRAARRLLSVLAVAFGVLHLPVPDASAETVGAAAQRDGEEPGYAIAGCVDKRCGSVSPHPVRSLGQATRTAHRRATTRWACGGRNRCLAAIRRATTAFDPWKPRMRRNGARSSCPVCST